MEKIKFVTYDFINEEAGTYSCLHGAHDVKAMHLIAVVNGRLCPLSKECAWCAAICRRIQSRTMGRPL